MKLNSNENGLSMIIVIILILLIAILLGSALYYVSNNAKKEKDKDIKSNMLLIQCACKVLNQTSIANKKTDALIGKKLSEYTSMEEDEENIGNANESNEANTENEHESNQENELNNSINAPTEISNEEKIIQDFKKLKIIEESNYDKYYVLTDEDLSNLKLDVKNEKNSYYLINYETNEVVITKGYNGKYKISEIENND